MNNPTGTCAVTEAHRFDESALCTYMQKNLCGPIEGIEVRQFQGGQSNPTFYIDAGERAYVLRKQPPGKLLPSAHAIDREYRVMSALRDSQIPVPAMHLFCEDPGIIGTSFYLMDYLPGRIFTNPLIPEVSPGERADIYRNMNQTLARIHSFDWLHGGLENYGRQGNYFARQIETWSKQYLATKTEHSKAMDQLMTWLPDHIPQDDETTIVHGDFRLGNLIFHPDKPEVIGVLDWELSTLGNPLSDLAFNCMTYHLPAGHEIAGGFTGLDIEELNIPDEQTYLNQYCEAAGRGSIEEWHFYMAFSLFRTAAIMQGVYFRSLKGNASSANAYLFGDTFQLLARKANELIQAS